MIRNFLILVIDRCSRTGWDDDVRNVARRQLWVIDFMCKRCMLVVTGAIRMGAGVSGAFRGRMYPNSSTAGGAVHGLFGVQEGPKGGEGCRDDPFVLMCG